MFTQKTPVRLICMILAIALMLPYVSNAQWVNAAESYTEAVLTSIPERNIIVNYPDYIGSSYSNADLLIPATVEVQNTDGG